MGLIDRKKNIFTTIGAYTSILKEVNAVDTTNLFPSINNKKDIVPMLLDIMKVAIGSNALVQATGQLFTEFVDTAEPQLKSIVKKHPVSFTKFKISSIDPNTFTFPVVSGAILTFHPFFFISSCISKISFFMFS
jgi:hypothetical protein